MKARLRFETKIQRYAPRSIAFLGKRALSTLIGRPDVEWGQHATGFAGAMAWVLPNPSGAAWQLGENAQVDMIFDEIDLPVTHEYGRCVRLGVLRDEI
jgi:hypothetical protein